MTPAAARRTAFGAAVLAWLSVPAMALAGPPFLTDDPEPTDVGHWEIYAPLLESSGRGISYDGSIGAELNYGAAADLQLTLGLPVGFSHDRSGYVFGRGDLELSAKYRFYHDAAHGISVAAFPGFSLPTARSGLGSGRVTALLPVWAQKNSGPWSVFGGGGFAINPGRGNRNFWTGGIAVTRTVSKRLLGGVEVDRQGPDTIGGRASTSVGIGAIYRLKAPFRILASGGPAFVGGHRSPGFHGFIALGIDL